MVGGGRGDAYFKRRAGWGSVFGRVEIVEMHAVGRDVRWVFVVLGARGDFQEGGNWEWEVVVMEVEVVM